MDTPRKKKVPVKYLNPKIANLGVFFLVYLSLVDKTHKRSSLALAGLFSPSWYWHSLQDGIASSAPLASPQLSSLGLAMAPLAPRPATPWAHRTARPCGVAELWNLADSWAEAKASNLTSFFFCLIFLLNLKVGCFWMKTTSLKCWVTNTLTPLLNKWSLLWVPWCLPDSWVLMLRKVTGGRATHLRLWEVQSWKVPLVTV